MFITQKERCRAEPCCAAWAPRVALPFLEVDGAGAHGARAGAARPPLRFGAVYVPNGCPMDYWMPKGEAGALEITPILKPLERHRDQHDRHRQPVARRRQAR